MKMLSNLFVTNQIVKKLMRPCASFQGLESDVNKGSTSHVIQLLSKNDIIANKTAIHRIKLPSNAIIINSFNPQMPESNLNPPKGNDRNIENLRKLQELVEVSLPNYLDYEFFFKYNHPRYYSRDMIFTLDKNGTNVTSTKGYMRFFLWLSAYRAYFLLRYPIRHVIIKSIERCESESHLDITFGIRCFIGRIDDPKKLDEIVERDGRWFNYRALIYINDKPTISAIHVTQISKPDRTKNVSHSGISRLLAMFDQFRKVPARSIVTSRSVKI